MSISTRSPDTARRRPLAKEVLFVPCRITSLGVDVIVTGHLPDGTPTAIAFTSPEAVTRAMGASQTWIRLSARGLRATLAPRGITHLQIDPDLVAPNPVSTRPLAAPSPSRARPAPSGSRSMATLEMDGA